MRASLSRFARQSGRLSTRLAALCVVGVALAVGAGMPASAQTIVPMDQLMAPGALPDSMQGSASAPVVIIEYASMTCPHCAAFHAETWPKLKAKYVDAGKVKFALREFPLDPLATAAFMLARCAGPEKRDALVDLLYGQQKNWAFTPKYVLNIRYLPTTPLEFARPWGNCDDVELRSSRGVSAPLAHTTTAFARCSCSCFRSSK